MADAEKFKDKISDIISQECPIAFLGDDFDQTAGLISDDQADKIYEWIRRVMDGKALYLMENDPQKNYKGIPLNQILSFRKEIQIAGVAHRIMLIKLKNGHYIEFHLSLHKHYDNLRKDLGLTLKESMAESN